MATKVQEKSLWKAAAATMTVLLMVVIVLNYLKFVSLDSAGGSNLESSEASQQPGTTEAPAVAPNSTQTLSVLVDETGMIAVGTAPDEAAVEAMALPIIELYNGTANFEIGAAGEAAWAGSYREVILQLGFFSDATLEIATTETSLKGRVASRDNLAEIERLLTAARGFPPLVVDVDVSNDQVSRLNVTADRSQVTVSGDVPSETVKQNLLASIRDEYGAAAVIDVVSVDSTLANQLNLLRFASDVAAMSAFESFSISFSQGNSFAVITGGVEFIEGESELTPESEAAISTLPAFLQRTALQVRIIGHAEEDGDEKVNTVLSIDRAKMVAGQLLLSDLNSEQVIVIGRGGRAEADALLEGGKLAERSVDIEIGSALS